MAVISVTPEELRQQATTYSQKADEITNDIITSIESMNATIHDEWKGAAFDAFLNLWDSTLKPNLNTVAQNLQETHDKIVQQADASEDFDNQSRARFQ